MHAEPLCCYRPQADAAKDFASLPYDVFNRAEAAEYVSKHPNSFLAIDRPETAFEPEHDMYAPDVYAKASELLWQRIDDGTLVRDGTNCYYLYRLIQGDREQTGIVTACWVDDYTNGIIRRHELTQPKKELDRVNHIKATGCQTGPVFLVHRDNSVLEALVEAAKAADPLYDFVDEQGVRQTVWRISKPAAVESFRSMLEYIPRAYIADGHHRAASAVRVCQELRTENPDDDVNAPYNRFLAVLFPASQLTVLPYNRIVLDTNGLSESELVAHIADAGFSVGPRSNEPVAPTKKGVFGMYAFGAWRTLTLVADRPTGAVESLDVQVLQDRVLSPVLNIDDPRTNPRIRFVGGNEGTEGLERRAGETGVAFSLKATSVDELMDVADAGLLMPPKSTWFEPKLLSGLFIRRIATAES